MAETNTDHIWEVNSSAHPFAHRRTTVGLVRSKLFSQFAAGLQGGVVDGLKDLDVEQLGLRAFKWITHEDESIGETLHPDSDGPVAHVGPLSL